MDAHDMLPLTAHVVMALNAHVVMAQNTVSVPDNYSSVIVQKFVQVLLEKIPDILPVSEPITEIGDELLTASTRKFESRLKFSTEPFIASEDDINEFVNNGTQEIFDDLEYLRSLSPGRKIRLVMYVPLLPAGAVLNPVKGTPEMTFITRYTYLFK